MIGIMTFHAAHNFGSVLQAFATQQTLDRLGYKNEIINYRLINQIEFYNHFYTPFFGTKQFIRSLKRLPEHWKRSKRRNKFEDFINTRLRLTLNVFHTYEELKRADLKYSILISGSDQVWNKYCTAEFKKEPPESIYGYYLAFGEKSAARIAISSSFGTSKEQDLIDYAKFLDAYDEISVREETGVDFVYNLTGKRATCTLDPTLFFSKEDWNIEGTYERNDKFVLLYTLRRRKEVQAMLKQLLQVFGKTDYKVVCIAPFSPVLVPGVENRIDCGPLDFISYIKSAALVVTDSFHGTAFSLNLETPFYTVSYGPDKRKELLLNKVGLTCRYIDALTEIGEIDPDHCFELDFTGCRAALKKYREESINYIRRAVGRFYQDD